MWKPAKNRPPPNHFITPWFVNNYLTGIGACIWPCILSFFQLVLSLQPCNAIRSSLTSHFSLILLLDMNLSAGWLQKYPLSTLSYLHKFSSALFLLKWCFFYSFRLLSHALNTVLHIYIQASVMAILSVMVIFHGSHSS